MFGPGTLIGGIDAFVACTSSAKMGASIASAEEGGVKREVAYKGIDMRAERSKGLWKKDRVKKVEKRVKVRRGNKLTLVATK